MQARSGHAAEGREALAPPRIAGNGLAALADADQAFVDQLVADGKLNDLSAARLARICAETGECAVGALVKLGYVSEAAALDLQVSQSSDAERG